MTMILRLASSLFAGALFGMGLSLSKMTHPEKVLGFLDVTGAWDPTLAFVLAGAVLVAFVAFRWILKRPAPLLAPAFELPTRKDVDARLVGGSVVFGIGWGIAGLCPGPALAILSIGAAPAIVFVASMVLGMILYDLSGSRPVTAAVTDRSRRSPDAARRAA